MVYGCFQTTAGTSPEGEHFTMNIKICTDSTCDLSKELIEKYNIHISPLSVIKDGESFLDGVDITTQELIEHVNNGGSMCSTSAVNIGTWEEVFEKYASEYDAVICVTLGSGFSSCYQNAVNAAEEMKNVYVVDSMNLSTGEGLVVIEAARLAEKGLPADEIVRRLEIMRTHVEASFILNQLTFLRKGGRCSTLAALGANILKIKPCIKVKDGMMGVAEKYRGTYAKCLEDYVRERLESRQDLRGDTIFITHTLEGEQYVPAVTELIRKYAHFDEIIETDAGCTISCHCGPSTLGILFVTKD